MNLYRILLSVMLTLVTTEVLAIPVAEETYKAASEAEAAGDFERAYTLFQQAAESGYPLAYFSLGLMHRNGWGRGVDAVGACRWFAKAAEGGIPYGQHLYGECLEQGINQQADPARAAYWYQQAAEGGHALSSCYLGRLYMEGRGVEKAPRKALALCQAAAVGSSAAMVWMGRFFLEGDESIRDNAEALRWFGSAMQYELPEAYFYLGLMSERGLIQEYPPQKAVGLYEQAASRGYVPAYLACGRLYLQQPAAPDTGHLSAHDLAKAYMWLSAAEQRAANPAVQAEAKGLLEQVQTVMPESWRPELDARLKQHLDGVRGQPLRQ